jgi:hypothetical protein
MFTLKNPGNGHVDDSKLAEAVQNNDQTYIRTALQGFVPNPVTYLTEGEQHSIELRNGHLMEVKGSGSFELPVKRFSAEQLTDTLERAVKAGLRAKVRFAGT